MRFITRIAVFQRLLFVKQRIKDVAASDRIAVCADSDVKMLKRQSSVKQIYAGVSCPASVFQFSLSVDAVIFSLFIYRHGNAVGLRNSVFRIRERDKAIFGGQFNFIDAD